MRLVLLLAALLTASCATPIEIPGPNEATNSTNGANFANNTSSWSDAGISADARSDPGNDGAGAGDTNTSSDAGVVSGDAGADSVGNDASDLGQDILTDTLLLDSTSSDTGDSTDADGGDDLE